MKFQLQKLGCALTWYENAIPQLLCASTESKSSLHTLRWASEIKKIKLDILRSAFAIMLLVPISVTYIGFLICIHQGSLLRFSE